MMDRQRLKELWRPVASAVHPDAELRQRRAAEVAINGDGTINEEAVVNVLPWQRIDFHLAGEVVTGPRRGGLFTLPQGARVRHIAAASRDPVASTFTATITLGPISEVISIPSGESANATGVDVAVPPGSWASLDVTSAGDAEDVTVTVHYLQGAL